jgi:sensor domain CHASE-containing protein
MFDESPRTDVMPMGEKRTSAATVLLLLLGVGILAAVGYDAYVRGHEPQQVPQQQVTAAATAAANTQLQTQLQDALQRVSQSDKQTADIEQERLMWMTLARAAVQTVAERPPTLQSIQRSVFGSADAQTRQGLRDYFKNPTNLEKVTNLVVLVSGMLQPGRQTRAFIKACEPLFMGPLPDIGPSNADALWCYEFLKRRQAEGGDVGAWQKLLAAAAAELDKKT